MTTSLCGREQQMRRLPSAGVSSGFGLIGDRYFTRTSFARRMAR
jgi:hypothetical protein